MRSRDRPRGRTHRDRGPRHAAAAISHSHGPAPADPVRTGASLLARELGGVRARVPEDREPARHRGPGGRRSLCRAADRRPRPFLPRASSSSSTPSTRASPATCSTSSIRTSWRRRRRWRWCRWPAIPTTPTSPTGRRSPRGSGAARAPGGRAEHALRVPHRAAHCALWPIEVQRAQYFTYAPDLPLAQHPQSREIRGGLRIALRATAGLTLRPARARSTSWCSISAAPRTWPGSCTNACSASRSACWCSRCGRGAARGRRAAAARAARCRPVGFEDDEALLPVTATGFSGHRLVQEYFAFPQRFQFVAHRRPARALSQHGDAPTSRSCCCSRAATRRSRSW